MATGPIWGRRDGMNSFQSAWLAGLLLAASAWAQDPAPGYPARPIRVIVPFPAGGAADALPRIVGERLAARWGSPSSGKNPPGASAGSAAGAGGPPVPAATRFSPPPLPPLGSNPACIPNS